ncbi:LysR family transcriptional regulator [Nocardia alni]|uniref:LysR family transcriptional regulator n=1 Tax=Nocardia alni TaxID=2815723 RepID=UPI001C227B53|nr:LysR family transcriptional regulator [Nocardia alni]
MDRAAQVSFHDLEVLLAFSATEHLGQAADHLGMSVPSVQRAIRALEDKLGVRLVEREGRRLRLRNTGWVLVRQAAGLLRSRADAVDAVLAAAGANLVPLRIGHTFSLGIAVVPRIVAAFQEQATGVRVMLRQGAATAIIASLLSGEVDAAFTSISPVEPDVRVVPLFEEPMLLAVPTGDALDAGAAVELSSVADRRFVAMSEGSNSRGYLMRACARAGFTPRIVLDTDDLFSVTGAVAAGIGVSVLPGRMGDYGHPGVALLPLIETVPTRRTVCLAYRRQPGREAQLRVLREVAQRYVGLRDLST